MDTNKPFPPMPQYNIYAYPIIPNSTIKKFLYLYSPSIDRWIPSNTESYNVLNTFRESFELENLEKLVDTPNEIEFNNLLETNPVYAPSRGGMQFLMFTPVSSFFSFLRGNMYEGPPPELRDNYNPDIFDEAVKVLCGAGHFEKFKAIHNRMTEFIENYDNQTKQDFIQLTKEIFCMPMEDDWV